MHTRPSMFTSISRGRVNFRSNYICTSCLSNTVPHHNQCPARQIPNRESFSTTSHNRKDGEENVGNATETAKKSGGRIRRNRPAAISHSKDALSALKRSLQVDESDSKAPSNASVKNPQSRKRASKKLTPGSTSKAASPILKEALVEEAKPKLKIKSPAKKRTATEDGKPTKSTEDMAASTSTERKPAKAQKLSSGKGKKPKKKALKVPKSTSDAPQAQTQDGASKRPNPKRPTKVPTDAQRRKVEALLLGVVKSKQAAVLDKQINSTIYAIGETEIREVLVKAIEDGNLSKDGVKAVKRIGSKFSGVSRSIKQAPAEGRLGKPLFIRSTPSSEKPAVRRLLSKPIETASRGGLGAFKSLKAAMKGGSTKSRIPRQAVPTRIRSKPGENILTGPLKQGKGFEIQTLDASGLKLVPIDRPQPQVPRLWYGLERVLFNPGVYHLQDPRSRVFNFDPYLQNIMPVSEFDFTALKQYITSSRDETLLATAKQEDKKYTGSTSSMTAALAHFHFLLSQWRPINTETLSKRFPVEYNSFTALQRGPSAVFLRWKDGVYAIDADKQFDTANILADLGKSMEKFLTIPTEDFEKYRKQNSDQISSQEREAAEAFNYTTIGDFLLRSQLDAHDPRLPGTGMFDLKTRAVVSIRMDVKEYKLGMDYEIRKRFGEWESYEREYYDMIRAAFLKYSLQVRMGRMDGIFVAFHNIQRIFGFQYISQPEMDLALHGTEDTTTGDSEFKMSLELLNKVLNRATAKYPEKSLRLHFETRGTDVPFMYIFAEPMEDEQITEIQEFNKAVVEEFEQRVLGLDAKEELSEEDQKAAEWLGMRVKVEENMEKDELDIEEARAVAEALIDESPLFGSDELSAEEKEKLINKLLEAVTSNEDEEGEVIAPGSGEEHGGEGVEGASADSESDESDEVEDDIAEEEDENEEEEDEEEIEEEREDEEEIDEERGDFEKSDSLARGEEKELPDDGQPDAGTEERDPLVSELLVNESVEADNMFQNDLSEDADNLVDEVQNETSKDDAAYSKDNIGGNANTESFEPDSAVLAKNKDLMPDESALTDDLQDSTSSEESTIDSDETAAFKPLSAENPGKWDNGTDVLAMTLTIRNKVNGRYVARPEKLTSHDKWTIEYALEDVPSIERSRKLYIACQTRRSMALSSAKRDDNPWNDKYLENLRELSRRGKSFRDEQNQLDQERPLKVLEWDKVKDDVDQKRWDNREVEEEKK